MRLLFASAALALLIACGCARRTPGTATSGGVNARALAVPTLAPAVDAAVDAALAKGKATLPQLVAALKNPRPQQSEFSVYAYLSESAAKGDTKGAAIEYFYLDNARLKGDGFEGVVSSEPKNFRSVKRGQTVTVPMKNATDWQYVENGELVGGHSMRVSLNSLSAAEQADLRAKLPYSLD